MARIGVHDHQNTHLVDFLVIKILQSHQVCLFSQNSKKLVAHFLVSLPQSLFLILFSIDFNYRFKSIAIAIFRKFYFVIGFKSSTNTTS